MIGKSGFFMVGLLILAAVACRDAGDSELLVLAAQPGTFEIKIPAFGELQSVTATPLTTPPQLRGRQTIAWIAVDNTMVKKGEAVVRLNSLYYLEQIKIEEANIAKIDLEIAQKTRQMQKEKSDIQGQIGVTTIEKKLADVYAARDESIYSRNKIIEDGIDLEYLKEKERHFRKKGTQLERKTQAELQLLLSRRKAVQTKLDQFNAAMRSLEIQAPHEGLFIVATRWNGEKFRVGMDIWGGEKLGTLPDLDHMQAKLFVLESEASGLKEKLPVSLAIDLEPGRSFSGRVVGIDTIAKPLDEKSPLKYFEVKASLDRTDTERDEARRAGQGVDPGEPAPESHLRAQPGPALRAGAVVPPCADGARREKAASRNGRTQPDANRDQKRPEGGREIPAGHAAGGRLRERR